MPTPVGNFATGLDGLSNYTNKLHLKLRTLLGAEDQEEIDEAYTSVVESINHVAPVAKILGPPADPTYGYDIVFRDNVSIFAGIGLCSSNRTSRDNQRLVRSINARFYHHGAAMFMQADAVRPPDGLGSDDLTLRRERLEQVQKLAAA